MIWADNKLTQKFSTWGKLPVTHKWVIAVIAMFDGIFLWPILEFARDNPQTMLTTADIIWLITLLIHQVWRHGIVVTAIAVMLLLLLLKQAATMSGADSMYVDCALKGVEDIPRIVVELVIPWVTESLSPLLSWYPDSQHSSAFLLMLE